MIVLDASALIALWKRERGWETVNRHVRGSAISAANVVEALSKFADEGGDLDAMMKEIGLSGCEVVPVSAAHALGAAKLRPLIKSAGLSLGDRLCLALAIEREWPVITADRAWDRLGLVPVRLLR